MSESELKSELCDIQRKLDRLEAWQSSQANEDTPGLVKLAICALKLKKLRILQESTIELALDQIAEVSGP